MRALAKEKKVCLSSYFTDLFSKQSLSLQPSGKEKLLNWRRATEQSSLQNQPTHGSVLQATVAVQHNPISQQCLDTGWECTERFRHSERTSDKSVWMLIRSCRDCVEPVALSGRTVKSMTSRITSMIGSDRKVCWNRLSSSFLLAPKFSPRML